MRTTANNIIVRISEAERRSLFEKEIKRDDGTVVYLATSVKQDKGMDEYYAQSLCVGEIVAVGANVKDINPGDFALLDYIVDVTDERVIYENQTEKLVSVNAVTTFKKHTNIVPPNRRTPHETIVYYKGEMDEASQIIAIVRDNVLKPIFPYVVFEHEELTDQFLMLHSGIFTLMLEDTIAERKVVYAAPGCEVKPGISVVVESNAVFARTFRGKTFDFCFEHDIFAEVEEKLSSSLIIL